MTDSESKVSFGQAVRLAVLTGVLAACTGIGATWLSTSEQRSLAKEQFLRSERAKAYAEFVGASEDLLRMERNASFLFEPREVIRTQLEGQDEIDALGDVNVKLQTAAATVKVVGPPEVADRTTAIVKKMEALSDVYFRGFSKLHPTPGPEVVAAVKAEADPLYGDYYQLKEEFLTSTAKSLAS